MIGYIKAVIKAIKVETVVMVLKWGFYWYKKLDIDRNGIITKKELLRYYKKL